MLAARETCDLPVFVTMTFEENGAHLHRLHAGDHGHDAGGTGVAALGVNCSLGPQELLPIVQRLSRATALPLIVKANAGLPDPQTGLYHVTPEEYAQQLLPMVELGAVYPGRLLRHHPRFLSAHCTAIWPASRPNTALSHGRAPSAPPPAASPSIRCASSGSASIPTGKKRFQQALRDGDLDYIFAAGRAAGGRRGGHSRRQRRPARFG